ncbi:unnamed protein product [Arabidopsis halleri]
MIKSQSNWRLSFNLSHSISLSQSLWFSGLFDEKTITQREKRRLETLYL